MFWSSPTSHDLKPARPGGKKRPLFRPAFSSGSRPRRFCFFFWWSWKRQSFCKSNLSCPVRETSSSEPLFQEDTEKGLTERRIYGILFRCEGFLCSSYAGIAQSVEQLIRNQQVACSSHVSSSTAMAAPQKVRPFLYLSKRAMGWTHGAFRILFVLSNACTGGRFPLFPQLLFPDGSSLPGSGTAAADQQKHQQRQ